MLAWIRLYMPIIFSLRTLQPTLSLSFIALSRSCAGRRSLSMTGHPTLFGPNASKSSSNASGVEEVHILPYDTSKGIQGHTKVLHLIRHAEGYHNVNSNYQDISNLDARLTAAGIEQCRTLSTRIQQATDAGCPLKDLAANTDLVVTSPLTRCVQTALLTLEPILRARRIPVVAIESLRETVNFNCDRRRPLSELSTEFKNVDFSNVETDHDEIWEASVRRHGCDETYTDHRESAQLHVVADRGREFFRWLRSRPEEHVTVCTHSAFLRCILHYGLDGGVPLQVPQHLDTRRDKTELPVVRYGDFEKTRALRADFANCELRSMVVHFPSK